MKRFLYYFIWTLAIGLILYSGMQLQERIAEKAQMSFNPLFLQIYIALFPVVIGLLIRTPTFFLQLKGRKSLSYDWIKFAAIGLPALYIVMMTFLPFTPLGEGWLPVPKILLFGGTTVPTVAGLVLGYLVLGCFKSLNASTPKVIFK